MENRIVRLPAVAEQAGYSRSTLYRRVNDKLWTRPIRIGTNIVGWPANEVELLIAARIAGQSKQKIRLLVEKLEANRKNVMPTTL